MDYAFFENLSAGEAREYFERYLELEARELEASLEQARSDGVEPDFSVDSVVDFFDWMRHRVRVISVEPPADTPAWLRESMEQHHGGFLDFDDASRPLVLRASYYLGQSFTTEFDRLEWAIGRAERAEFQQPVVTGFRTDADLPVLAVAENLLLGSNEPGFEDRARTAMNVWRNVV